MAEDEGQSGGLQNLNKYSSNKHLEIGIREIIPYTIASKHEILRDKLNRSVHKIYKVLLRKF